MKKILCVVIAMLAVSWLLSVTVMLKDSNGNPYRFDKTLQRLDNGKKIIWDEQRTCQF